MSEATTSGVWPDLSSSIDDSATTVANAVLEIVRDIRAERGEEPTEGDVDRVIDIYGEVERALLNLNDRLRSEVEPQLEFIASMP